MQSDFQCSYCGEWNSNAVDESAGPLQQYVEDCEVCCRPIEVRYTMANHAVCAFEARAIE